VDNLGLVIVSLIIIITFLQVVARYVFDIPLSWSEEAARYLLIWLAMIGSAMALRTKGHIQIETFVNLMPSRVQTMLRFFRHGVLLVVLGVILFYGYSFASMNSSQFAAANDWLSMFWPCLAIPVGAGFMLVYVLKDLLKVIIRDFRKN
jgi:TRAP-type C4-dicarboxylate transport system permease small subunit